MFIVTIIAVYTLEAYLFIRFSISKLKKSHYHLYSKWKLLVHLAAILGIFCFLYGYFIEPYWIEVKNVVIHTNKLTDTSVKIVQISDLHCDERIRNENKLVKIINPLSPDIIVFTGDTLNTSKALPVFKKTLSELSANIGKFAIKGNFDIWFWDNIDLFNGTGFTVLDSLNVKG